MAKKKKKSSTKRESPPVRRRKPRRNVRMIAGRNFTAPCADTIARVADQRELSPTAVIVDVLEGWARRHIRRQRPKPPPKGGGRSRKS